MVTEGQEITSEQVDELLAQAESPAAPMEVSVPPEPPKEQQTQEDPEVELTYKGEAIKLPMSKVKSYAQQAYDYNVKMKALNEERQAFASKQAEIESLREQLQEYQQVQEWAKQNPSLWEAAQNAFQQDQGQKQQGQPQAIENSPAFQKLFERLDSLESKLNSEQDAKSDQALDQQINEYKTAYPDFDWVEADENGDTLEQRIINHATENGISSFKAAANDMLLDKIIEKRTAKAKQDAAKEIQRTNRLGITPLKPTDTQPRSNRNLSYEELEQEALTELGL